MPTLSLEIDVPIDETHEEFLDDIDERIEDMDEDKDAVEFIQERLEDGMTDTVERMIYEARQQLKRP